MYTIRYVITLYLYYVFENLDKATTLKNSQDV